MRQIMLWLAALLAALLLLYAGLNLAEHGLHELLALERPAAAFTLRRGLEGGLEITFGGSRCLLDLREMVEKIKTWGAQVSLHL